MEINEDQLKQIKVHLKVDHDDEDGIISAYASAAVGYIEDYCDVKIVDFIDGDTSDPQSHLTPQMWTALLLLVGNWYANKEASGQQLTDIPFGVDALLIRQRNWSNNQWPVKGVSAAEIG